MDIQSNYTKSLRIKSNVQSSINYLAMTNEERIVKTANQMQKSRINMNKYRSQSLKPDNTYQMSSAYYNNNTMSVINQDIQPYHNNQSLLNDHLNYSSQVDKAQKNIKRWQRVLENKEKLTIDQQLHKKLKIDKSVKQEKNLKKKFEEIQEDMKGFKEVKQQKFSNVLKKRDQIYSEYENKLKYKEEKLNQRIQISLENKKKQEQEYYNSKLNGSSNSKYLNSELNHSHDNKGRAKSAYDKYRRLSNNPSDSQYYQQNQSFDQTDDEDEHIAMRLQELEHKIARADEQKNNRLYQNIEKWHQHNEEISVKQQIKQLRNEEREYLRLKSYIDKNQSYMKKQKKQWEDKQAYKEVKFESITQKEDQKKARMNELRRQLESKIVNLEKKFQDKDQMSHNIRQAIDEYSHQKRELKQIKKQDQENNLRRQRRVQSAYKRILIDKLLEKEDRFKMLQEKKMKIQEYREKNIANMRNTYYSSKQQQQQNAQNNNLLMRNSNANGKQNDGNINTQQSNMDLNEINQNGIY
eukprot:403352942